MKRFREGLVFKAHRLLYHSTLGLRVIQKKKNAGGCASPIESEETDTLPRFPRIAVLRGKRELSIPRGRVAKVGSSNSYHREVRGSVPGGGCAPPIESEATDTL